MALKELLISTKPREVSGSRSANRFDFQKSWALCRLLELHQSGKDYLLVFDYHDDVLVLNSCSDPTQIDFFQIKTRKSGHWTRKELIAREQGKNGPLPSILGKLVGNRLQFPNHIGTLNFVSTQGFKVSVNGKAESVSHEVCLKELTSQELNAILTALRSEHSLASNPDCADCTHLSVTSLSLGDHGTHATGALANFLEQLYPGEKVHLPAIYRTLCDEIKRKTNVERLPKDFDELCAERSIGRERFKQILDDVKPASEFSTSLSEALSRLQSENMAFDEVRQLREACNLYEIDRMEGANVVLQKSRKLIGQAVTKIREQDAMPPRLTDAIARVVADVERRTKVLVSVKSSHYRSAMILMAIYGF